MRTSPFLFPTMRELTADFGVAAAIAVGTLTAWGSGVRGMEMLKMASKIEPADGRGSWVVDGAARGFSTRRSIRHHHADGPIHTNAWNSSS